MQLMENIKLIEKLENPLRFDVINLGTEITINIKMKKIDIAIIIDKPTENKATGSV